MLRINWGMIAATACAIATLAFAIRIVKPYPIWETWHLIPLWDEFANGGPWLRGLFADRWGHVVVIPNAINILVGYLTNYSMRVDVVVTWLAGVVAFLLLLLRIPHSSFLVAAIAATFFGLRAFEVWLSSWNLMWPLAVVFAVAIGLAFSGPLTPARMLGAALVATAGMLTLGVGLPALAAPLVVLSWRSIRESKARWLLAIWPIVVVGLAYAFRTLRDGSPGLRSVLSADPVAFFRLASFAVWPTPNEVVGLVLIGALLALLAWNATLPDDPLFRFWLFVAAFVLATIVLMSIIRPLAYSRYLVVFCLLPICTLVLLKRLSDAKPYLRMVFYPAVAALFAFNVYQSYAWAQQIVAWEPISAPTVRIATSNPDALSPKDFEGIGGVDAVTVASGLATMKRLRVNIFSR